MQSVADQQAPEAGAVEEQVPVDHRAGVQLDRLDEAGRRIHGHLDDLALDALDTERFRKLAQETRIQARVEVVGVVHAVVGQVRELALE